MKKFMLKIMPVLLVAVLILTGCVFAKVEEPTGTTDPSVKTFTGNIFQTVKTVVQVLAIAAVIFAGVRYMFASADGKADIKQQTIILIVGAILVFAAVPILNLVQNISNNLIK